MGELSKTAKASMQAGLGMVKKTPVSWAFEHQVGKWQTKPYKTFYSQAEAEEFIAQDPERFFLVEWPTALTNTRRR